MILSSVSTGMGDILTLTAIAKHFGDCEVQLQPKIAKFARFFRDISSKITITDNIQPMQEIGDDHYTLRKLRALGYAHKCYLPYVHLNAREKEEASILVKSFSNPIVFVANSAPQWKFNREPHNNFFQPIIDQLAENHTVLQFGLSDNFTEYRNTIPMLDMSIDNLIKYYYGVGKYIGIDTGDTHLMLATGGSCDVFIPQPGPRQPQAWNYDHPRIRYFYFN